VLTTTNSRSKSVTREGRPGRISPIGLVAVPLTKNTVNMRMSDASRVLERRFFEPSR
jgi:hypothetical protein